jgi:2-iminobutanoate/2-iminopropanoate deaminase
MAESHDPEALWSPFGAFSMLVLRGHGQIVDLKGQVALDKAGCIVGGNDMRAQVRQVLANILTGLSAVGGRMSDVISMTHYTTDIKAFMKTGDIRAEFFTSPFPVTTTVEVASLYDTDLVIEITVTAEIPTDRFVRPTGTRSMHG